MGGRELRKQEGERVGGRELQQQEGERVGGRELLQQEGERVGGRELLQQEALACNTSVPPRLIWSAESCAATKGAAEMAT